jgi:hypothetical protein
MKKKPESQNSSAVNRRAFLTRAGLALAGTTMLGNGMLSLSSFASEALSDTGLDPTFSLAGGGSPTQKPVYLPPQGSKDPAAHSLSDSLFWTDIMMEHALFFVLLMPGDDLAPYRAQAQDFQGKFARHFALLKQSRIDKSNYKAMNQRTIALVRPFHAYKLRMLELQTSGRMHSLVWPLFFTHTAREAQRFVGRLEMYSAGRVEFPRGEVVEFWTSTMGEHAQFISHLLDPQETALIQKAHQTAGMFLGSLKRSRNFQALMQAGEEIIDFKTAAAKGIETGQIKSIIHPALADHVRREAVKYVDELKRT